MLKILKQILSSEKGQALPAVLGLLVFGGLVIVPSLNYATASLNASQILREGINGVYAADAGVEDALWCLGRGVSPSQQLPENINQMEVTIQTEEKGTYTLYLGELIQPSEHSDYLDVDGEMVWDDGAEAYKYTITVTWQPESGLPTIHLVEVGVSLPVGYEYRDYSSAEFPENLSTDDDTELTKTLDTSGAWLLNWDLKSSNPSVSEEEPVRTQTFYITGEEEQEGHYAWVVANRNDIGAVGEITGTSYRITATASRPTDNVTTARIVADVMIGGGTTYILSWQISG